MRIGIFVMKAGTGAGGLETYDANLIRSLARIDSNNDYRIYCLAPGIVDLLSVDRPNFSFRALWPHNKWISIPVALPLAMARDRLDLFHGAFVPPPFSPCDYVFTLHDVYMFLYPEFLPPLLRFRLRRLLARSIRKAAHIICVSQSVHDHVAERFGVAGERLSVVYHGVEEMFRPLDREANARILDERYGISGPYLFFAGRFEPRKNVVRILEAFDIFRRESGGTTRLVLAGEKTWSRAEVDATIARLGLREDVIELGNIPRAALPPLYSGALAFVFPSLWEGFGLPIVEAMACGTPVITGNLSAMPEIAGGAALLVDPNRVDSIAEAMLRIAREQGLREALIEKGLSRAREFDWDRTARETLAIYQRLGGKSTKRFGKWAERAP